MMRDNKNIMVISTVLLIGIVIASLTFFIGKDKDVISLNNNKQYHITKEIKSASDNLLKNDSKSEVIEKVDTREQVIGLAFEGLADLDTNKKILDLITKYNRKVDFFIPGILAVENSNFVKEVYARGHRIGSNTLSQSRNMQHYSQEELLDDFVQTNTILKAITGQTPQTLMCRSTTYTDDLLRISHASGNTKVVKTTEFLNYQSFKDYKQVLEYINNLEQGSIITVKMDGVLEEDEFHKSLEEVELANDKQPGIAKSSIEKQPGIGKEDESIEEASPEEKLMNLVNWLLKALDSTDFKVVFAEELESYKEDQSNIEYVDSKWKNNDKAPIINNGINTSNGLRFIAKKSEARSLPKKNNRERLEELRIINKGKRAEEYSTIYTSERALSYTFYGIENTEVLYKVLNNLDLLKSKGSFFITKKDIVDNPALVKKIAELGHEIGIGLLESQDKDFYSTLDSILFVQEQVKKLTDQRPNLVRYPYYIELEDEILGAISSGGCSVIWQDISIASSKVGIDGILEDVIDNAFGQGNITAPRGYIVYYRMDYYNNPNIIPDAMLRIAEDRIDTIAYNDEILNNGSSYSIRPVGSIMQGDKTYKYPLNKEGMLNTVRDVIYPGHLSNYTDLDKFNLMKDRYIRNPNVGSLNTLPGFTEEELEKIDTSGVFTDDKVIFLTFDDWASDKPINQLLYVLEKHGIKGSFFISTEYMQNNPNILRAIAESGHDVGSHTDSHLTFSIRETIQGENSINSYRSPNEEELSHRKKDLQISYNKLQDVIGDISINNRPALTTIFRPPELSMSKAGMESVLDMGFSHIVSGDFSTQDYEDRDPEVLVNKIINGITTGSGNVTSIQNGSILIMHMYDFKEGSLTSPNVTAKALDIAIPILKSQGYKFARLSDYL